MNSQTNLYRLWTPARRLQAAYQLYLLAKETIRAREKRLHPEFSEKELEKRVRTFFR